MPDVTPSSAEPYDGPLRYWVPSRRSKGGKYLVELDAYDGNGCCQCKDFAIHFEPLLKRGFTAQQALDGELVYWDPEAKDPEDALRCFHVITAFKAFSHDMVDYYVAKRKQNAPAPLPNQPPNEQ